MLTPKSTSSHLWHAGVSRHVLSVECTQYDYTVLVQIIIDDSKERHVVKGHVLFCDVGFAYIFSPDNCYFKVILYIQDEDMLITNSLTVEAKLVKFAKSCNKEHSEWFVL